jgi:hypothetical protein
MIRVILAGLFALAVSADTNLTGEWALQFTTPRGPTQYTLYLTQEGPRLTGHLSSEFGEQPVRGSVNGDEVKISWSEMEGGKPLEITLTGTAKGETITGMARLGTVGEGPFRADRTGS